MFGVLEDIMKSITGPMHAEEMQTDQQVFNAGQAGDTRAFNSAEAIAQRDWQERMASTSYQRATADMKAAGLNPMLAYHQGGSNAGSGAHATASPASSGIAHADMGPSISAGMQSASQIELNDAVKQKTIAEEEESRARAREIDDRRPTHKVTREHLEQQIKESQEHVRKMIQETTTSVASAANITQQTKNLQETVAQIQQTVNLLRAQIPKTEQETKTGKAQEKAHLFGADRDAAAEREISQRVTHNLPALEAALRTLEAKARALDMPRRGMDAAAHDSFLGALSAVLRALNPFANLSGAIR